jgi:ABC-2 type transport system permease protein
MATSTVPTGRVPTHRLSAGGQAVVLAGRSLSDRWRSLLTWGLGLVGIAVVQLAVYPSVAKSGAAMQQYVDQWPEAFKQAFGLEDYASGSGFLNAEMFSMVVPLVLIAVALGAAAAATAGEEERGTLDLLMSMPVRRWNVVLAKTLAMVAGVTVVGTAAAVTIIVGAPLVDLEVAGSNVAAATFVCGLLGLLFGAVGLLLGALTGSRGVALGAGMGLALGLWLLNVLAPMADWLEPWQKLSPFYWAMSDKPLDNGVDWPAAGLIIGLTVLLAVAAAAAFERRDISTR